MLFLAVGALGLAVGSFLNVCIFRLPKGESVVTPRSHCMRCGKTIAWYDNIPVASFLGLKGRCRHCQGKISPQYVMVEIFAAILFVLFYQVFGLSVKGGIYLVLTLGLLVESLIDLRHRIIPDEITLPGIVLGLLLSALFPALHTQLSWAAGLWRSVLGVLVGGGCLYVLGTVAEMILKKEAMGGGDVKLLAMIGAFLGCGGVFWTVFLSSLVGSVIGLYRRARGGEAEIPFGPFLGFGAVLYVFYGQQLTSWYAHTMGLVY